MAGGVLHAAGGISALLRVLREEGVEKALAFDLMDRGRSIHDLGSIRMSWVELDAFLTHAPPGAAIRRLRDPLSEFKTAEGTLLSAAVDTLAGANWQRGGGKGPRPKPFLERAQQELDRRRQDASAPASLDQMAAIRAELSARRRRAVNADSMTKSVKNKKT